MVTHTQETVQKDNADRRYLPRWTTHLHALWKKTNAHQGRDGSIKNLSCAGECLRGDTVFAPHEAVHLVIDIPWEPPIRVDGIVCWVVEKNGQKSAGIRFLNVDDTVQDAILHYMLEAENINLADLWFKDWK